MAIGRHVVVVHKGKVDVIGDGLQDTATLRCGVSGSGRRCGGQGDLLAGSLAVFTCWAGTGQRELWLRAAYAACRLVRECNAETFADKHRGMLASDMVQVIPQTFARLYERN